MRTNLSLEKKALPKEIKEEIFVGAIMIASLMAMVPMVSAQTEVSLIGIKLWHILLSISIFFAILTFTYPWISKRRRKEKGKEEAIKMLRMKDEEVIEILKEVKELKRRIEEKEKGLTTAADLLLTQILFTLNIGLSEIRSGINAEVGDLKALILFGIATLLAISFTIISLL
jgi:hypothetical protein